MNRATVCSGHAELCDRSYGNVTFVGSHDSAFFDKNPLTRASPLLDSNKYMA
jgi:hypothetical protein